MHPEDKATLRQRYLAIRRNVSPEEVEEKSRTIQATLLDEIQRISANTVMAYVDFANEVQTQPLIKLLLERGAKVAVPKCERETKELSVWQILDMKQDLAPGSFSILEPTIQRCQPVKLEELEMVLVPGVAFDLEGFRIGRGMGYYDRFLARLPEDVLTLGLAYDWQLVSKLPRENFDQPVKRIVTEKRILNPHSG